MPCFGLSYVIIHLNTNGIIGVDIISDGKVGLGLNESQMGLIKIDSLIYSKISCCETKTN